jgi:hypothetical protein
VDVAQPVLDFVGGAVSMKAVLKQLECCKDLVSLTISILIAATDSANELSSKCTALPSLALL